MRRRIQASISRRLGPVLQKPGFSYWEVLVWEAPPSEEQRLYTIMANSDTMAAMTGIRRLEEELRGPRPMVH